MKFLLLVLLLVGCDQNVHPQQTDRPFKVDVGYKINGYVVYEVCIKNVVYYYFAHSITPAFNPDNTVRTCK